MIATPGIIGRVKEKLNLTKIGPGLLKEGDGFTLHRFVFHIDIDLLPFRQVLDELAVNGIDGIELSWPGGFLVRPTQPGSRMSFKLGRKIITELFRG